MKPRYRGTLIGLLGITSLLQAPLTFAQENTPADGGWRRLGDSQPTVAQQREPQPPPPQQNPGAPPSNGPAYSNGPGYNNGPDNAPPLPPLPDQLTIQPGTFFTIRVNQVLSSDRNQPGDAFTAQLVKPIVIDGVIVADRGQTIAGRVAEVDKGGRVKGTSRLGIELTELSLVDGQQVPVHSQLIDHTAPTSVGRDAAAVGTTTAVGAVIGAA